MSGTHENGKTITEGSRALECFTDRTEAVQRFNQYLNEDPAQRTFLFFHGVGGNGKSLLLRFLRKHCCRPLTGWESLQDVGYQSLLKAYPDQSVAPFPSALLDFGMQPNGEDRPQEAFPALLMLRRSLSGGQLRFPLYDFACVWYLHKTKRLSPERLASLFPAEELAVLTAVSDVISKTAFGTLASSVINAFSKHFKERATIYWQARRLEAADVERIQGLDAETELLEQLPAYFAEDLNASMLLEGAPRRVVLFFDTHESLWGQDRSLGDDYFHRRDQWFRHLLKTLQPEKGIVVICAGQELPRWSKARRHPIPDNQVEYRLIGNLSEESAQEYLLHANIEDPAKRSLICAYAAVEPGQVHPLFLGLCADILLEAEERKIELAPNEFAGSPEAFDVGATLVERLLRYVDEETADAVRAVSACRAFDRDIYFKLARELHFSDTDQAFRKLTRFSFVSPIEGRGAALYRIHDLLRRLIHELDEQFERRANEVLEAYYRQLAGPAATAEAIYHASRLDWKRGIREWVKVFDAALWASDYQVCRALLAVRGALGVRGHLESGMLARCEADFCACRALYAESKREYQRAIKFFEIAGREGDSLELERNKARLMHNLADLQGGLSELSEAAESNKAVIEVCDRALSIARDDVELSSLKAGALLGLGDIDIWESKRKPAIENYSTAVKVCDRILQHVKDEPLHGPLSAIVMDVINDKAYGIGGIGDVESSLYNHKEAIRYYRQAEHCYDEALRREFSQVVQNDKAYNYVSIAESEIELSKFKSAFENCQRAGTIYDEIIKRAPEDVIYHSNRGRALRTAGLSLTRLSRYDEALEQYRESIASCSEALRQAPADTWAINNLALVFLCLGELCAEKGEYGEALLRFEQSLDAYERFSAQSPADTEMLAGRGCVWFSKGEVLRKTAHLKDAAQAYRESVASFDRALELETEDAEARKDRAQALQGLGEIYLALDDREVALDALGGALGEYGRALAIAPRHVPARCAKEKLEARLEELSGK